MIRVNLQLFGGRGASGGGSGSGGQSVTEEGAAEDWFEYEYANLMVEYIRTGVMPTEDMYGNKLSKQQREKLAAEAELIQRMGENTNSGYNTLHRGMVMDLEEVRALSPGEQYTFRTLSATSPDRKLAGVYSNVENRGGEGVPVMFEIQRAGGINGFKASSAEVVIPKGSSFRITRNYMDEDGVVHVSLYASKKKKR